MRHSSHPHHRPLPASARVTWTVRLLISFALSALPVHSAAQEGKPAAPALTPGADTILERVAENQGGKEIATNLRNFEACFESRYYDPERGQIYYEVKRIFQLPDCIWTEKKHELNKKPTIEGFDGEDGWIVTPDGRLTVYTDKPATYKNDLENLQEDMRLTRQMFRYFFIANLRERIQGLKRLPDRPVPRSGKTRPAYVLEGKVTGWIGKEKTVRLLVYVDPERFQVQAVRMDDLSTEGEKPRLFLFDKYFRNEQGVLVPTRVAMYRGEDPKPEMTLSMDFFETKGTEGNRKVLPRIRFNIDLAPDLFHVPEKKGKAPGS